MEKEKGGEIAEGWERYTETKRRLREAKRPAPGNISGHLSSLIVIRFSNIRLKLSMISAATTFSLSLFHAFHDHNCDSLSAHLLPGSELKLVPVVACFDACFHYHYFTQSILPV